MWGRSNHQARAEETRRAAAVGETRQASPTSSAMPRPMSRGCTSRASSSLDPRPGEADDLGGLTGGDGGGEPLPDADPVDADRLGGVVVDAGEALLDEKPDLVERVGEERADGVEDVLDRFDHPQRHTENATNEPLTEIEHLFTSVDNPVDSGTRRGTSHSRVGPAAPRSGSLECRP